MNARVLVAHEHVLDQRPRGARKPTLGRMTASETSLRTPMVGAASVLEGSSTPSAVRFRPANASTWRSKGVASKRPSPALPAPRGAPSLPVRAAPPPPAAP